MSPAWWVTIPSLLAVGFASANLIGATLDMKRERVSGRRGSASWVMGTHGVIVQILVLYHAVAFSAFGIDWLTHAKGHLVSQILLWAFVGSAWVVLGIAAIWPITRRRIKWADERARLAGNSHG